jgi:uncharacterized protein YndB with AHSA1/START domain
VTKIDARTNATANVAEREVVITRVFDAPRGLVFKAWTDPEHMARWWGPTGFTNTICELDARVGGAWRIVMRSPAGIEYPCGGVYREIVERERLVFTNIATDNEGNPVLDGLTTVIFAETHSANARCRGGRPCSRVPCRNGGGLDTKPGTPRRRAGEILRRSPSERRIH